MDVKSSAVEGVEENEEHVIGKWRKGNLYYIVMENLAELCPLVMRKAEVYVLKLAI